MMIKVMQAYFWCQIKDLIVTDLDLFDNFTLFYLLTE